MKRNILLRALCAAALLICLLVQPLTGALAADAPKASVSERDYYGVSLGQFQLGYSGWGDKITLSKSDVSGVTFASRAPTAACAAV